MPSIMQAQQVQQASSSSSSSSSNRTYICAGSCVDREKIVMSSWRDEIICVSDFSCVACPHPGQRVNIFNLTDLNQNFDITETTRARIEAEIDAQEIYWFEKTRQEQLIKFQGKK